MRGSGDGIAASHEDSVIYARANLIALIFAAFVNKFTSLRETLTK
jgi:hypothetical protein